MRASSLPCFHQVCGTVLLLVAAGCNAPDATNPTAGLPEVPSASPQVPAATASSLSITGKVAFVRNGDIYVVNGSGTVTRLTNSGGSQPTWSPGGSKIEFVRSK